MDSIAIETKVSLSSLNQSPQKTSENHKKDGILPLDYSMSDHNNASKTDNSDLQTISFHDILMNGINEKDLKNSLELENSSLQLRLKSSFAVIEAIKSNIMEFENTIKTGNDKSLSNDTKLINHLINNQDSETLGKIMCTLKRKLENSDEDSDSRENAKKRKFSRSYDEEEYMKQIKENRRNNKEISELRAIVKKHKTKIDQLERQLEMKQSMIYMSESQSESHDGYLSENSSFKPYNNHRNSGYKKKNFSTKNEHSVRKSRGRPRKTLPLDQSSNSITEQTIKRGRGRPRKSVPEDQSSNSLHEPIEKRGRGRPRKYLMDEQSSTSVNLFTEKRGRGRPRKSAVTADNNSSISTSDRKEKDSINVTHDSDTSKSAEKEERKDIQEQVVSKEKRSSGRKKSHSEGNTKEDEDENSNKHKGAVKKSAVADHEYAEKRIRVRQKTFSHDGEIFDKSKEILSNTEESPSKSRGRPKKTRSSNEADNAEH